MNLGLIIIAIGISVAFVVVIVDEKITDKNALLKSNCQSENSKKGHP